MPSSSAVPLLHFSTDAFPERERLAAWRDIFGRTVVNLDIEPHDRDSFRSEATLCRLPGLGVLRARSSAVHLSHSRDLIVDDDLSFMAAPTCKYAASQFGRNAVLGPGDGVLMDNAEVGSMTLAAPSQFTTFRVPRKAIEQLVPNLEAKIARAIPASHSALLLLTGYLGVALDTEALGLANMQNAVAKHVYDLLALALGATPDAAEIARGRGERAARLHAAKAYVMQQFGHRHLSVAAVAAHLGVTPRYVHMLFENENESFSEFVLGYRLARAHVLLIDPRFADRPIGAIALDAGFNDLSHFNRTFRRRFGCTPSDVRKAAQRGNGSTT